jgi:HK97 family phage portal protein
MGIGQRILKLLGVNNLTKKSFALPAFAWIGGYPVYNPTDAIKNINDGYVGSEDVYSIGRRISRTAAMVPLKVYKIVDDNALKNYQFASSHKNFSTQTLLRNQFLKTKALELVGDNNALWNLIDNPNPTYSKTEFYEGVYTMRLITGNAYIHTPLLEFGVNAGTPKEMWILPTQWTSLQVSDTWPRTVIGYRLQMAALVPLAVEEVIHIRYFNPQYSYVGNELIGLSPLRAGSKILTQQEAERDYSVNAFQNSGISGIVYNESARSEDIEQGVLGKMKADFYNEASGTQNARKLLFMAGKLGYQQIGLSPVDMNILASEIKTFKKLCNLYGVSDRLFNNDATGAMITADIAYKDLYTNAALPEVYALRDALNKYLTPKFNTGKDKFFIDCDITGITELQDDMKDMAIVFSSLPVMNPGIIAKAFNWDYDNDDPNMDKYFIKQGYQTVEDAIAGAIQPLPIDTQNGN